MYIFCIRRGTNIAIEANVRTITLITNHTRTLQEVFCIEKLVEKIVNNVTVNYVTMILLKSKYPSKCIHLLKKC